MAKNAVYQIRMDAEIKNQVEELYRNLGTSFAEAVREQGMPFIPTEARGRSYGMLSSLADPKRIPQEESAFLEAMVSKHAGS